MADVLAVFDRKVVRQRWDRSAVRFGEHDFLFREVAERLLDRLDDITRAFPLALDLGCQGGVLAETLAGRGGIETLVQCELSEALARRAAAAAVGQGSRHTTLTVVADEEGLPFAPATFDLILSNMTLHWVNDLPGALIQARCALKPDGLFLATLLGAGTLTELRGVLAQAEIDSEGGLSPRVSPFADVRDGAHLLQRAGFVLPVADVDRITVSYPDLSRLVADLRGTGATNALLERRKTFTRSTTLAAAAALYQERFAGPDGRIPATFEVITLTGWTSGKSTGRGNPEEESTRA
ncbi:MAG: methyltransferase domain-containing protein [Alphaproteobacteria bacterium]|nr:methyltransferase domain-containing protein [Alphaproteobacteria bacterium]